MAIYKVEGQKATLYVKADSQEFAYERICDVIAEVPRNALKFTVVKEVPKGAEAI
jgi:hypothetical protein